MGIQNSKIDLALTIFKALSIYSFILSLEVIAYRFPIIYNIKDYEYTILIIIQVIATSSLLILGGLAIWFLSPALVNSIFKHGITNEQQRFSYNDFHIIIFSAIGLYALIDALPEIINTILFYYQIHDLTNVDKGIIADRNSSLIGLILQLILGLWLLFGSRSVVKLIRSCGRSGT